MKHYIIFAPEAADDFRSLDARDRSTIKQAIKTHLRYHPTKTSKSRIKRLRGLSKPQFRLRVDDFRVFYDVVQSTVHILAIVSKRKAFLWLEEFGETQ